MHILKIIAGFVGMLFALGFVAGLILAMEGFQRVSEVEDDDQ